jgi:excisionase family DNA binding protein
MDELLTITEFASALKITPACVRRWIIEKRLSVVKLGRLVRIPRSEVDRLIADGFRPAENRRQHGRAR